MFNFESSEPKKARIEIIPMIDVMMFLLVFFVLISLNVIPAVGIPTNLPQSTAPSSIDPEKPVIITVRKEGTIDIDGQIFQYEELSARLTSLQKSKNVIVKSDRDGRIQDLVRLMDSLKIAGVLKVSIATSDARSR